MNIPLVAFMSVDTDVAECVMTIDTDEEVKMVVQTPVFAGRIPSNYGLITWNGQYITVS